MTQLLSATLKCMEWIKHMPPLHHRFCSHCPFTYRVFWSKMYFLEAKRSRRSYSHNLTPRGAVATTSHKSLVVYSFDPKLFRWPRGNFKVHSLHSPVCLWFLVSWVSTSFGSHTHSEPAFEGFPLFGRMFCPAESVYLIYLCVTLEVSIKNIASFY